MAICPNCGIEMDFIGSHGEWYCPRCHQHQVPLHESMLPPVSERLRGSSASEYRQGRPRIDRRVRRYEPEDKPSRLPPVSKLQLIMAGVVVIVLLLIASLYSMVYFTMENGGDASSEDDSGSDSRDYSYSEGFPVIEMILVDGQGDADLLTIKHIKGDPLDWSNHKIIVENNSDTSDMLSLNDLSSYGIQYAGEKINIIILVEGKYSINFCKSLSYTVEIFDIKANKRTYYNGNLICE